jgi:hypothetical protein
VRWSNKAERQLMDSIGLHQCLTNYRSILPVLVACLDGQPRYALPDEVRYEFVEAFISGLAIAPPPAVDHEDVSRHQAGIRQAGQDHPAALLAFFRHVESCTFRNVTDKSTSCVDIRLRDPRGYDHVITSARLVHKRLR